MPTKILHKRYIDPNHLYPYPSILYMALNTALPGWQGVCQLTFPATLTSHLCETLLCDRVLVLIWRFHVFRFSIVIHYLIIMTRRRRCHRVVILDQRCILRRRWMLLLLL